MYGKISGISKTNGTVIAYKYDPSGNRICKTVTPGGGTAVQTIYVRDASGNVMSIYTLDAAVNGGAYTQSEISLYGSSRLGVWNLNRNVSGISSVDYSNYRNNFVRGAKFFELSNHLGNVLVTVNDKKIGHNAGNGVIDYFTAEVVTANDYYPGGMDMPGRQFSSTNGYRYGFNGKEKDNKDGVIQYDYGFRIYDPRLVRFKSVDPLTNSFPWYTPYQFAGNMPIVAIDLDGLEEYVVTNYYDKKGKLSETVITILTKKQNGQRINMQLQKEDGSYVATQNVLVRNVSYDGTTSYVHQSSLNKQQKNIVEKATKELIDPKKSSWAVGFGGGEETGGDAGEDIESEKKDYNKKYDLTDYSSKKIVKPAPIKAKVTPPKTDTKPLPIKETSTSSFSSSINFWANTASTQYDGYKQEVADIVDAVKGKSDYSITIYGNFGGEPGEKFSDKGNFIMKMNGYKTYGDLALARANKIKSLLVAKGLDASKINTTLGTEGGGMTADYKITTTVIK